MISDDQQNNDELIREASDKIETNGDKMERYSQKKRLPRRILLQVPYTR